jgi:hypothetical protein
VNWSFGKGQTKSAKKTAMKLELLLLVMVSLASCTNEPAKEAVLSSDEITPLIFDPVLATELARRAEVDQTAAWIPEGKYKSYSLEDWQQYKDSVFMTNQAFLLTVLEQHGFPGIDLVGEKGAHDFWLMTQHCDFDPDFQEEVRVEMKVEMKRDNASKSNYAYLVDRVRKNRGQKILYGTQVRYNKATGQAMSQPLEDSLNVNQRRAEVGLETLEAYLNGMTLSHFEMNKENMLKRGIQEPKLYELGG